MKKLQKTLSVSIVRTAINALQVILDRDGDWLELSDKEKGSIKRSIAKLNKIIEDATN